MSDEGYPPIHMSHLVRKVVGAEPYLVRRDWTGNDESRRNHVGVVYLSESPLRLRLSWKEGRNSSVHLIGVFDLDLIRLLEGGYVRREPGTRDGVRLRFLHGSDDVIYIQVNNSGSALPVGKTPI